MQRYQIDLPTGVTFRLTNGPYGFTAAETAQIVNRYPLAIARAVTGPLRPTAEELWIEGKGNENGAEEFDGFAVEQYAI